MNELYWITRLDAFHGMSVGILVIAGVLLIFAFGLWAVKKEDSQKQAKKLLLWALPSVLLGTAVLVFVPSTNEALAIYGVGGTIDYIKSNDKAQQLPDKVVDALDRYVDAIAPEKKDTVRLK